MEKTIEKPKEKEEKYILLADVASYENKTTEDGGIELKRDVKKKGSSIMLTPSKAKSDYMNLVVKANGDTSATISSNNHQLNKEALSILGVNSTDEANANDTARKAEIDQLQSQVDSTKKELEEANKKVQESEDVKRQLEQAKQEAEQAKKQIELMRQQAAQAQQNQVNVVTNNGQGGASEV